MSYSFTPEVNHGVIQIKNKAVWQPGQTIVWVPLPSPIYPVPDQHAAED